MSTEEQTIFLNVVVASALASLVGFEREIADKPAGLRTNMIVGGFTCLIVAMAPRLNMLYDQQAVDTLSIDPVRILQAIILGVSFIGAGTIVKSADQSVVKGITTAATLLYSCGIGVAVALHYYWLAGSLAIFILITNFIIGRLARFLERK